MNLGNAYLSDKKLNIKLINSEYTLIHLTELIPSNKAVFRVFWRIEMKNDLYKFVLIFLLEIYRCLYFWLKIGKVIWCGSWES